MTLRPRWLPEGFFGPVDYAARVRYRRPPGFYRRLQSIAPLFRTLRMTPSYVVELEVPGRRTGVPRRTLLVKVHHHGDDYLVALAGESEWVRNVRAAAGSVVLGEAGRRYAARLAEVPIDQRGSIIAAYIHRPSPRGRPMVRTNEARHYFGIEPDASPAELTAIAPGYPVFRIGETRSGTMSEARSDPARTATAPPTAPPTEDPADPGPLIDRFLPRFDLVIRHADDLPAPRRECYAAVTGMDLFEAPLVRFALSLRAAPQRIVASWSRAAQGSSPEAVRRTFRLADMTQLGWILLGETPDVEMVLGQVSRPWQAVAPVADLPAGPAQFTAFDEPGYAKIATSLRVDDRGPHGSTLTVETRVACTDEDSRRRFRRYWVFIGPGSALIRRIALRRLAAELRSGNPRPRAATPA